ncbi:hypothetical protein BFS06_13505 [Clostridium perfringens]|uniref:Uncharacterized protein n=1 Tax=Clostridium perfringens TaxID=1502 RepID=A0A140GRX2_CLOPF|nr:hypothetical protein [Clostridium perfringens]AMN31281.1 hypothetical protein JFP838_pA0365 [Clostridium perfringens]TBX14223.1 hypothetical protein BFS06_13505 [Clostridium perfringens]
MSNDLYKRYEKMETKAGNSLLGSDFREEVADLLGKALKNGEEDLTLKEFLVKIEEWFEKWY